MHNRLRRPTHCGRSERQAKLRALEVIVIDVNDAVLARHLSTRVRVLDRLGRVASSRRARTLAERAKLESLGRMLVYRLARPDFVTPRGRLGVRLPDGGTVGCSFWELGREARAAVAQAFLPLSQKETK